MNWLKLNVIQRNYGAACSRYFERGNQSYRTPGAQCRTVTGSLSSKARPSSFENCGCSSANFRRSVLSLQSRGFRGSDDAAVRRISVLLHANSVNSILHPHVLSKNMLTSCLHSLSSCSTLRWPVVYFQLPRSVPLSLQLSRRWHWIRSIWVTNCRFPIWHLILSCLNSQLRSK